MKKQIKVKKLIIGLAMLSMSNLVFAAGADDPLLYKVMIDKIETSDTNSSPVTLEADMWLGKDLNKFWLKTDIKSENGVLEENAIELLYSKAVYAFWDLQMGIKIDKTPTYSNNSLVIGYRGLAPYLFDIDTSIAIEESGQVTGFLQAEYEYMVTQKFIISPELTLNINTKDDAITGKGSGLANLEFGIRARYEIKREFAPYIGVNWNENYGKTADYIAATGNPTSTFNFIAGVRTWF